MSKMLNVLSKNIIARMGERTQQWLAKESGVNQGSISQMLSGKGNPSIETIEAIAVALNSTTTELLGAYKKNYDVPQDILELLEDQSPAVYDTIRTLLKTIAIEKKSKRKA